MSIHEIAEIIDNNGTRHNHIAKKLGMSKSRFSKCINGKSNFTANQLAGIKEILGIY